MQQNGKTSSKIKQFNKVQRKKAKKYKSEIKVQIKHGKNRTHNPKHSMRGLETDRSMNRIRRNERTRYAGKTQIKYTDTNDKTRNR